MAPETLQMLRCPVTQSPLTVASEQQVASLNQKIQANEIVNQLGQTVTLSVQSLLISADGKIGCAVRSGIIQMIADEAISIPDSL
jgi:uncharacterized protein YbaR (Trm112 family)